MKGWAYVALAGVIFLQNKGKNHKPTSQTNIKMGACPYRRVLTHKTGKKTCEERHIQHKRKT